MIRIISGAFASVITTRAGAAGSEVRRGPMLRAGHFRHGEAPPMAISGKGAITVMGLKDAQRRELKGEKLWPAWHCMARRTPGASFAGKCAHGP